MPASRGALRAARPGRAKARRSARAALALLAFGLLTTACSLTSLDRYFECEPGHPDCKDAPLAAGGSGSGGDTSRAGASTSSAGNVGSAGDSVTPAGVAGEAGSPTSDAGASQAGSSGATGAGPGEPCSADSDCARGTCYRELCGDAFELTYKDTPDNNDPAAKWIKFQFSIANRTLTSYPLSAFKIRYYYSPEDVVSEFEVLATATPPASSSDVTGSFGSTSSKPVWTYLELGFTDKAGTLAALKSTGAIKVGVHDKNFGPGTFTQANDYSYLTPSHLTLYRDDVLLSGEEPK